MTVEPSSSHARYQSVLSWLFDRIDYERVRPNGLSPFRLERMEGLLEQIGRPHLQIPAIHIAGTKGKGSTAAVLESILRASGLKTGLFTSPHIARFEERMRIDGRLPAELQVAELAEQLRTILEQPVSDSAEPAPTFFEITTLLAWMLFAAEKVDIVVLETGLGGRLDCTNVCRPLVTLITSIGLDHTHILGATHDLIAYEKAGILKPGIPLIHGPVPAAAEQVIAARATELQCPRYTIGCQLQCTVSRQNRPGSDDPPGLEFSLQTPAASYTSLHLPLLGHHQARNASLAVMAAELLQQSGYSMITQESIASGVAQTVWPLRFEQFPGRPTLVLDAAHNPDSLQAVAQILADSAWPPESRTLIFAASSDKDAEGMLAAILPAVQHVILTQFCTNPRSIPPRQLLQMLQSRLSPERPGTQIHTAETPAAALQLANSITPPGGVVLTTGSAFLAAEMRAIAADSNSQSPFASQN